jgi:ATP-binding cassette, subfamily B, heavy metal transporter
MSSVAQNLKIIFPYLWEKQSSTQKTSTAFALIMALSTVGFNLSIPLIFKELVNTLSHYAHDQFKIALLLLIAYGLCWTSSHFCEKLREMIYFKPIGIAITHFSLDVFKHLHSLSLAFHLDRETGKVSGAIQRAQLAIAMLVTNLLFRILPVFLEALLAFLILWHVVGLKISIILILMLALYLLLNSFVIKLFKQADTAYQNVDNTVDKRVVDSFLNCENIKMFHAEEYESNVASQLFTQREDAIVKVFWAGTFATTSQSVLLGLGLMVISYYVGLDILDGKLNVGDFVLVNGYLILLINPLEAITGFIRNTISYSGDLSHATSLLQETAMIKDVTQAKTLKIKDASIEFNKVCFSYEANHKRILNQFNLSIPQQSMVAIVGTSGSGKSTLARLLFRFYDLDEGAILIDGQDIKHVTKKSLRQPIAYVPQDIVLLNETLKYNIAYGNFSASMQQINAVIQAVHLDSLIEKLPDGLNTKVGERGVKLSGGERQRIAIARALLKKPKIIIFDEATSHLDTQTEKQIQSNIEEITQNITTIIIAHRLSTVVHADKIVMLDQGKVTEEGTHKALLSRKGAYATLWKQQHEKK